MSGPDDPPADSFLERVARVTAESAPVGLAPGTVVGDSFRIERRLGAGGMGVVYLARDLTLGRDVAVKLHRAHGGLDRLQREAVAMARLAHPNVVAVHEVGRFGDALFVAMEYVAGHTLRGWMATPRPWRAVVALLRQIGEGLAAAHDAGLVHRDFKPENVMIGPDGRPRVGDFGLVRVIDGPTAAAEAWAEAAPADELAITVPGALAAPPPSVDDEPTPPLATEDPSPGRLTVTGAILGTPAYMAPEQFVGDRVDARADQFSFCVVLHEALYQQRPFAGRTPTEIRATIAAGTIARGPGKPDAPRWLDAVITRGLAADPDARFPSLPALLAAIDDGLRRDRAPRGRRIALVAIGLALAAGGVVVGRHVVAGDRAAVCPSAARRLDGIWDDARRDELRRRFVATGAPTAETSWRATRAALDARGAAWIAAHDDACAATHVRRAQSAALLDQRMDCLDERLAQTRVLVELLAHADAALVARAPIAVQRLESVAGCSAAAVRLEGAPPVADAAARARSAELAAGLARVKALIAIEHTADAATAADQLAATAAREGLRAAHAEATYWAGVLRFRRGQLPEALPLLEQAAEEAVTIGRDDLAARALGFLGFLEGGHRQRFVEAERMLRLAQAALDRRGGNDELQAWLWRVTGSIAASAGRPDDGVVLLRQAVALMHRDAPAGSVAEAEALAQLGRALTLAGRGAEALAPLGDACAIYQRLLGDDSGLLGDALLQLGFAQRELGHLDDALATMQRALALRERVRGEADPSVIESLIYVGEGLVRLGRDAEAIAPLTRAATLGERHHTPYPDVPRALMFLGLAHLAQGDRAAARTAFEQALAHPLAKDVGAELGRSQLGLARALGPTDRARAITLARQARATLGDELPEVRAEVDAWLAAHP